MFSHETDILRKIRLIEWLKAELVTSVGQVFQAIAKNSQSAINDALAAVLVSCYILGKRLGIDFEALEEAVLLRITQCIAQGQEAEKWQPGEYEVQIYVGSTWKASGRFTIVGNETATPTPTSTSVIVTTPAPTTSLTSAP